MQIWGSGWPKETFSSYLKFVFKMFTFIECNFNLHQKWPWKDIRRVLAFFSFRPAGPTLIVLFKILSIFCIYHLVKRTFLHVEIRCNFQSIWCFFTEWKECLAVRKYKILNFRAFRRYVISYVWSILSFGLFWKFCHLLLKLCSLLTQTSTFSHILENHKFGTKNFWTILLCVVWQSFRF